MWTLRDWCRVEDLWKCVFAKKKTPKKTSMTSQSQEQEINVSKKSCFLHISYKNK